MSINEYHTISNSASRKVTSVSNTGGNFATIEYSDDAGRIEYLNRFNPNIGLTNGIKGFWKFDEASGTRYDAISDSHFTPNGGVTQSEAGSVTLDGVTGTYLQSSQQIRYNVSNFTVACRFKISAVPSGLNFAELFMLDRFDAAHIPLVTLRVRGFLGNARFACAMIDDANNQRTIEDTTNRSTSTWYHLVYMLDYNGNMHLYLDGAWLATNSTSYTLQSWSDTFTYDLYVGYDGPTSSETFNGIIDYIGFWNRPLLEKEITELYNGGTSLEYPFNA